MFITNSYVGTAVGKYRYLFFVLYEDYNDIGRAFVGEFEVYLERLARNLKGEGAVVRSFAGDIEATRDHVLGKDWTPDELAEIVKVPSLLVISVDFDDFSPRDDPWLLMHFGECAYGGPEGLSELAETFKVIAEAVTKDDTDELYAVVRSMAQERPDLTRIFEAKPGMFGFSFNVIEAGAQLRAWLRGRRRPASGALDA